jgi:FkbM family methyltransferase
MTMRLAPGYPAARTYLAGLYEPDVSQLFQRAIRVGMTVVDAGANIGYYTLLASHLVGTTGRVYSFEPDTYSFSYLIKNIEANGCLNASPVNKALSSRDGVAAFFHDPHGAESFLTIDETRHAYQVSVTSLDSFFRQLEWPPVHLVKLDIEGAEMEALAGMRELSQRNPDLELIMELNEAALLRFGSSIDGLISLLKDLGFTRGSLVEAGEKPFDIDYDFPRSRATYNVHLVKRPTRSSDAW